jgi:FdhE protein
MTRKSRIADPVDIGKVTKPPRLLLPHPSKVFRRRAERFDELSGGGSMPDFLTFMADMARAQSAATSALEVGVPPENASGWAMPPLDRTKWRPHPSWRHALAVILDRLSAAPLTAETRSATERLAAKSADALDALAERAVHFENGGAVVAEASFVFAALQVCWTQTAGELIQPNGDDAMDRGRACPVCGSPPLASLVHSSGSLAGSRFLVCSLCATEWHLVRIKCANCHSTKGIAYLEIEGAGGPVKAETCDECRTYTKIIYAEKAPGAEAFADDLASLGLDLLVGEAGWHRAAPNPYLLPNPG